MNQSILKTYLNTHLFNQLTMAILIVMVFVGCEKDTSPRDKLVGKWQLVEGYNLAGGFYVAITEDKRIEEYTRDNERIRYDYLGNEISRVGFRASESVVTIFFERNDGTEFESSYDYWFSNDTLKIRNDGGNHFYDEFFIRID